MSELDKVNAATAVLHSLTYTKASPRPEFSSENFSRSTRNGCRIIRREPVAADRFPPVGLQSSSISVRRRQ